MLFPNRSNQMSRNFMGPSRMPASYGNMPIPNVKPPVKVPSNISGIASKGIGGVSKTLNNVQQVLKVVQSATPMVQEYGPMVKNFPAMYRMMKAFKDVEKDTPKKEKKQESKSLEKKTVENNQVEKEIKPEVEIKKRASGKSTPRLFI